MNCKKDGWYCCCDEHHAYWTAWAKDAIKPVVDWLKEESDEVEA